MYHRVSRFGLYHALGTACTGGGGEPWVRRQLALKLSAMAPIGYDLYVGRLT
jgi:hypothetical protein